MTKRIRYAKTNQLNILKSVKMFDHPTNGGRFYVVLDTQEKTYKVIDDVPNMIAASGNGDTLHVLKKNAKMSLQLLGISFDTEERNTETVEYHVTTL